jgi:hypothetical protein
VIATQRVGELVVIFGHEIDIAFVLDRRGRRLQRLVEVGKRSIGRIAPCFVELCEAVASERVSTAERFEGAKSVKRRCAGSLKSNKPKAY